jgi:hypothetical protein
LNSVFGWIKHVMGFRQFSLRGLTKVTGEWSVVYLALNLRRLQDASNKTIEFLLRRLRLQQAARAVDQACA